MMSWGKESTVIVSVHLHMKMKNLTFHFVRLPAKNLCVAASPWYASVPYRCTCDVGSSITTIQVVDGPIIPAARANSDPVAAFVLDRWESPNAQCRVCAWKLVAALDQLYRLLLW